MSNRLVDEAGKASNTRHLSVESFWVSVGVTVVGLVFSYLDKKAGVQFAEWSIALYMGGALGTAITARVTAARKKEGGQDAPKSNGTA